MKKLACLLLLGTICAFLGAQDKAPLYERVSASTVYIRHEVFLNPADCRNPALVRKLESRLGVKLISSYFPLASGSGFLVGNDGTVLTNRHVVQVDDIEQVRADVASVIARSLDRELAKDYSAEDIRSLKLDLYSMLTKGGYRFSASIGGIVFSEITRVLVGGTGDPDIAVLRIKGKALEGLVLADSALFAGKLVGREVFSFGFPLGALMERNFGESVVTMNKGTISALRKADLEIQHTAAISEGNSGGPLVDGEGLVLGMNTALVQGGNSLFFAIGADQIRTFLSRRGIALAAEKSPDPPPPAQDPKPREALLNRPAADSVPSPAVVSTESVPAPNALGELEVSSDVFVDCEKGAEVSVDDIPIGTAPLFLALKAPLTDLTITGTGGEYHAKLRMLGSLRGATLLKPRLRYLSTRLRIDSDPQGAMVLLGGKYMGRTPLETDLAPGRFELELSLSGYTFEAQSVVAGETRALSIAVEGAKHYPVSLSGIDSSAAPKYIFKNGNRTATFFGGAPIALPIGQWALGIEGIDDFSGVSIPLQVGEGGASLNLEPYKRRAKLEIRGLQPGSRVFINKAEIPVMNASSLELSPGQVSVYVWNESFKPFRTEVSVGLDKDAYVNFSEKPSEKILGNRAASNAVLVAALGLTLFALSGGFADHYVSNTGTDIMAFGSLLCFGITLAMAPQPFIHWKAYEKDLSYLESIAGTK